MKVISIYGPIGYYGMEPPDIRKLLDEANGEDIRVEINSPGGFVWDGLEIYHLFKNYSGNVHTHVMGLCASMTSFIALAGDKITSEAATVWMIHNPMGGIYGANYIEAEAFATYLKSMANMMAKVYAEKTGKKLKDIQSAMDETTELFGEEIKDFGLVDEIVPIDESNDNNDVAARDVAMACAKLELDECTTKMQSGKKKENLEKLAAFFKEPAKTESLVPISELQAVQSIQDAVIIPISELVQPVAQPQVKKPAGAGQNKTEVKIMTLEQILAEHPAVKIEIDAKINAAKIEGVEAGKKEIRDRIEKAKMYMDTSYPDKIKAVAVDVIVGTKSMETLEAVITVFDVNAETAASAAAGEENPEGTPAQQPSGMALTGLASTPEDISALVAADKAGV